MNARRARRKPRVLCFLPIAITAIAFLIICFSLTAGSAAAAATSPHITEMTHHSQVNPASLLLDPNIIFLFFIIAVIGIFLEVSHPGAILPGVVGAIALLLFLFGAVSLSPNWAGLALMALAFALLVLDIKLPAHGILTAGATISLIVGTLLFFNSGGPHQGSQVNPILVYAMGGLVGLVGLYVVTLIVRTRRRAIKTGTEGMIGAIVIASTLLQPVGRVKYKGEDWTAVLADPSASVDPGTEVRIVAVEGLLLQVQPVVDRLSDSSPKYIEG